MSTAFTSTFRACPSQPLPFLAARIAEYARSTTQAISPEDSPAPTVPRRSVRAAQAGEPSKELIPVKSEWTAAGFLAVEKIDEEVARALIARDTSHSGDELVAMRALSSSARLEEELCERL
eukprot:5712425-Prymnesium_polylepis.1